MRKRITVVGDLMIDIDHFVGDVSSKEDRQCLNVYKTVRRLGTAGAVGQMVAALGVDTTLISVAAAEDELWIRRQFPGNAFILASNGITTRRERFYFEDWKIAGPRVEFDFHGVIVERDQKAIAARALASAPDAIIVCDHAKGVVGPGLMAQLIESKIPVFVDPHPQSKFELFSGVECLAMNRSESLAATDVDPQPKNLISKLDADGLIWYREGWQFAPECAKGEFDSFRLHFPSFAEAGTIVDTIGAGDQFIAALAASRVNGDSWESAIVKANAAAGLQCWQRGIKPVLWDQVSRLLGDA